MREGIVKVYTILCSVPNDIPNPFMTRRDISGLTHPFNRTAITAFGQIFKTAKDTVISRTNMQ